MSEHNNKIGTKDVWFSAYLQDLGHEIVAVNRITRGKAEYMFELSEEDWRKLKLDFHNSKLSKYKSLISKLKDLAY